MEIEEVGIESGNRLTLYHGHVTVYFLRDLSSDVQCSNRIVPASNSQIVGQL